MVTGNENQVNRERQRGQHIHYPSSQHGRKRVAW